MRPLRSPAYTTSPASRVTSSVTPTKTVPRTTARTLTTRGQGKAALNKLLREVFGVARLRDGQQAVIDSVLAGQDTLVIMPTGGGKSLCYQLPAQQLQGTTIVVSPLISLMKDQAEKLRALDVPAVQLNSSLDSEEEQAAMESLCSGHARIVFCTPERLCNEAFLSACEQVSVALVAIDEAHCISQWGHDFRPAYLELAEAIRRLGRPPLLALTATAPEEVVKDIRRQLGAPQMKVINTGIFRANLRYRVLQNTSQQERQERALALVRETEGVGIVYAATVKAVKEITALLEQAGESVTCYHGKLSARERRENQEKFMRGDKRVMVATNAFGMGIDKNDTRFVLHLQMPSSLDAYYQESGRAGRDGAPADCTLLFLQDDKRVQQFFLAKHAPDAAELQGVYRAAVALAGTIPVTLESLQEKLGGPAEGRLELCLRLLRDGHLLQRNRRQQYRISKTTPDLEVFKTLQQIHEARLERDRAALDTMVGYAQSGRCRWKLLLDYFDAGSGFEHCCSCDNCVSPPAIMETGRSAPIEEDALRAATSASASADIVAAASLIPVGSQVRVPKYDVGTVVESGGGKVTIEFPDKEVRTFLQEFVKPARDKRRSAAAA